MHMCMHTCVLADGDVPKRKVSMCFSWSRMAVIDSTSDKGRLKETNQRLTPMHVHPLLCACVNACTS